MALLMLAFVLGLTAIPKTFAALEVQLDTATRGCFEEKIYDGSYNKWCLLFSKGLQIWKSIALGELDLTQPSHYFMCFIDVLNQEEKRLQEAIFHSFKVQRHRTKGTANTDSGRKLRIIEGAVDADILKEDWKEIVQHCSGSNIIYMSNNAINKISSDGKNFKFLNALESLPISNGSAYPLCEEAAPMWELGCICRRNICTSWFPCALKFCKGARDKIERKGKVACGISGCKQCNIFEFFVPKKSACFWNTKV